MEWQRLKGCRVACYEYASGKMCSSPAHMAAEPVIWVTTSIYSPKGWGAWLSNCELMDCEITIVDCTAALWVLKNYAMFRSFQILLRFLPLTSQLQHSPSSESVTRLQVEVYQCQTKMLAFGGVGCSSNFLYSHVGLSLQWRHNGCDKSPALGLFTQPFIQTHIKENIKAPRH